MILGCFCHAFSAVALTGFSVGFRCGIDTRTFINQCNVLIEAIINVVMCVLTLLSTI